MIFGLESDFTPWGPFINHETFVIQPVTVADFTTALVCLVVVIGFAASAAYFGYKQTSRLREPWKNAYIWMVWLEWLSCLLMAILAVLFIVRAVRPSFYLFLVLVSCWVVQTQCLLQIIVNRIRIILHDRKKGRRMQIGIFILMLLINISVCCLWMPARLQLSAKAMHINEIYDRIEKVLYLIMDAYLNIYFIKIVKANLIRNGLQKYNRLVVYNQCMIVVSLLMDLVIIGAMSLPNGFVYVMFHPLAYLVKLNIEMSMARLIKMIALGSNNSQNAGDFRSFNSLSNPDKSSHTRSFKKWAARQGASLKSIVGNHNHDSAQQTGIQKTEEFTVHSHPKDEIEMYAQGQQGDKSVEVRISSAMLAEEHSDSGKESKDTKESRTRQCMSDEETLIKPQLALLPSRRSTDSSGKTSVVSGVR